MRVWGLRCVMDEWHGSESLFQGRFDNLVRLAYLVFDKAYRHVYNLLSFSGLGTHRVGSVAIIRLGLGKSWRP